MFVTAAAYKFATWTLGVCNAAVWTSAAVLLEGSQGRVDETQITISLTTFVACLIGACTATHIATRYLSARETRLEQLERLVRRTLEAQGLEDE